MLCIILFYTTTLQKGPPGPQGPQGRRGRAGVVGFAGNAVRMLNANYLLSRKDSLATAEVLVDGGKQLVCSSDFFIRPAYARMQHKTSIIGITIVSKSATGNPATADFRMASDNHFLVIHPVSSHEWYCNQYNMMEIMC